MHTVRTRYLISGVALCAVLAASVCLPGCADPDAALFPRLSATTADALEITRGGQCLALARDADGWWVALPGRRGRASDDSVDKLFTVLARSTRREIVRGGHGQLETLGLADGDGGRISITSSGRSVVDTRFGADAPGASRVFLMPDGERDVFVSPDGLADLLGLPSDDWRDRRIMSFELPDVIGVELVNQGAQMVIAPVDGRWHMTRPVDQDVYKGYVDALLFSLAELEAVGFENERTPSECGFGETGRDGRGSVTVRFANARPQSVLFGGSANDSWYTMRPDRDDIYLVPGELVELIFGGETPGPSPR